MIIPLQPSIDFLEHYKFEFLLNNSIMNKNSQVIPVGTEIAITETGNKTTHILFDVNRDLIKSPEDLIMTMPVSILSKEESVDACRCPKCARVRKLCESGVCLECHLEL